jgi:hypothetical protein
MGRKHSEYNRAAVRLQELARIIKRLRERSGSETPPPEAQERIREFHRLCRLCDQLQPAAEKFVALQRARAQHEPIRGGT